MNNIQLHFKNNILKISGTMTFENIINTLNYSIKKTEHLKYIKIDLENINTSNSSILIFIINYIRESIKNKQKITFINIPKQLTDLSNVYNLNHIIHK